MIGSHIPSVKLEKVSRSLLVKQKLESGQNHYIQSEIQSDYLCGGSQARLKAQDLGS